MHKNARCITKPKKIVLQYSIKIFTFGASFQARPTNQPTMEELRNQLCQLLLLTPPKLFNPTTPTPSLDLIAQILKGDYLSVISQLIPTLDQSIVGQYPQTSLVQVLSTHIDQLALASTTSKLDLQLLAVACLQLFIQANFTGPQPTTSSRSIWFPLADSEQVQFDAVEALGLEGQSAYDLMQEPILLIVAELAFDRILEIPGEFSLFNRDVSKYTDRVIEYYGNLASGMDIGDYGLASVFWWKVRGLQVRLSVLSEPPSLILSISGILLNNTLPNSLAPAGVETDGEVQRLIQVQYLLESARLHIHSQTEHGAIGPLSKAKSISQFKFLLSGAKAKRTKFQKFHTSNLIVLAKSGLRNSLYDTAEGDAQEDSPESFELNSDLLLEIPHFESLQDLELDTVESDAKRIKYDSFGMEDMNQDEKLLPIAIKQTDIPAELSELDPNDQPSLSNIDNLQLLLRLTVLKQTSPSSDPLVEEELQAVVRRIIYSSTSTGNSPSTNWTIFSRALWERSLLETLKSRTIERGILQMTSLIEEMGLKIKTRLIPQSAAEDPNAVIALRIRFIHQLPLLPQWSMDAKLAEKYMSLGILKSALEIYQRLQLHCEAALCYAAVDNEPEAERILMTRLETHPRDARAISILGDIKQDPNLWLQAWEIGRYAKAKASLSHYYHSPPASSGLSKNIDLAIEHMHDCLTANPLVYQNWYFYGCCGLESGQFELASEAFTRCVALDDSNSYAWSNLASALLKLDKTKPAFNALKKAIRCGGELGRSWRIFENYMIVAAKLHEWNDVLIAARELIDIRKSEGDNAIDIPVMEKLVEILCATEYPNDDGAGRLTHYQKSCVDLICNILPTVITTSTRCWRIVARVELWRKRPWAALECHVKAYRAILSNPMLESDETVWNEAVDACADLVSAYESLGELPGKHNAGDVVCQDWKYKARSSVRSLMSKGKEMFEDSPGWDRLMEMKQDLSNN